MAAATMRSQREKSSEREVLASRATFYQYDLYGNLLRVDLPDGRAIEYDVDGAGRRVGRRELDVDGFEVSFRGWIYRDLLRPIAEVDASGNVVARYVFEDGTGTQEHDASSLATRLGADQGEYLTLGGSNVPELIERLDGAGNVLQVLALISDHMGSVRMVVDVVTGEVVQQTEFDEFGRRLVGSDPGVQPFGFAGGLSEFESDFTRFGARDYLPEVGRWTSKDPIRWAGGQENLYLYSRADPINRRDSTGLATEDDCPTSVQCGSSNCHLVDFSDRPCPTCPDIVVDGYCTYTCHNGRGDTNGYAVVLLYSWGGQSAPICEIDDGLGCEQ